MKQMRGWALQRCAPAGAWICLVLGSAWLAAPAPAQAYQDGAVRIDSQRGAVGGPGATIYQTTPRQSAPNVARAPAAPGQPTTFSNGQSTALAPMVVVRPSLRAGGPSQGPQTSGLRAPGY